MQKEYEFRNPDGTAMTMDQLPQETLDQLAKKIAGQWEKVAVACGIDPNEVLHLDDNSTEQTENKG